MKVYYKYKIFVSDKPIKKNVIRNYFITEGGFFERKPYEVIWIYTQTRVMEISNNNTSI